MLFSGLLGKNQEFGGDVHDTEFFLFAHTGCSPLSNKFFPQIFAIVPIAPRTTVVLIFLDFER